MMKSGFFLHSVNTVKVHLYIAYSIFITKQVIKLIPSLAVIMLVNWTARVNLKKIPDSLHQPAGYGSCGSFDPLTDFILVSQLYGYFPLSIAIQTTGHRFKGIGIL